MPGSPSNPVILDPWQEIVEVGWSDDGELAPLNAILQLNVFQSGLEGCDGDGMEAFNINSHSGNYITIARLTPFSVPTGSGFLDGIPVTFSGFNIGTIDKEFDEWEFAQKAFDTDLGKLWSAEGKAIHLDLTNVDGLSGPEICRDLPGFGTGRLSVDRAGSAVASGPSYDFSGGTATEIGGDGRTFSVSHVTLGGSGDLVPVNIYMVEN